MFVGKRLVAVAHFREVLVELARTEGLNGGNLNADEMDHIISQFDLKGVGFFALSDFARVLSFEPVDESERTVRTSRYANSRLCGQKFTNAQSAAYFAPTRAKS